MNFGATMAAMCFFMLAVPWNQTLLGPVLRKQDLEHSGWFSVYEMTTSNDLYVLGWLNHQPFCCHFETWMSRKRQQHPATQPQKRCCFSLLQVLGMGLQGGFQQQNSHLAMSDTWPKMGWWTHLFFSESASCQDIFSGYHWVLLPEAFKRLYHLVI
jgi:hypothetical protein